MRSGVYAILGPAGFYIGVTGNLEQRGTIKLARMLGLPCTVIKELPVGLSRMEQHKAEYTAIEDYRSAGLQVVTNGYYKEGVFPPEARFSNKGHRASAELRAKMSASRRGVPHSAAHCAAISAGLRGSAKLKAARIGNQNASDPSPETREKIGAAHRGKPWTAARRAAYLNTRMA